MSDRLDDVQHRSYERRGRLEGEVTDKSTSWREAQGGKFSLALILTNGLSDGHRLSSFPLRMLEPSSRMKLEMESHLVRLFFIVESFRHRIDAERAEREDTFFIIAFSMRNRTRPDQPASKAKKSLFASISVKRLTPSVIYITPSRDSRQIANCLCKRLTSSKELFTRLSRETRARNSGN
jgi:hypothetical protein